MTQKSDADITESGDWQEVKKDKHPKSGIISVIFSSAPLLMLLINSDYALFGVSQRTALLGGLAYDFTVVTYLLSIPCAIIGLGYGAIGIRSPKKLLPGIGLVLGVLSLLIVPSYVLYALLGGY